MSKLDDMRAMREARYEQAAGRAAVSGAAATPAPRRTPRRTPVPVEAPPPSATEASATTQACGHRSMNGRTCTREQGHAAKSHRYS